IRRWYSGGKFAHSARTPSRMSGYASLGSGKSVTGYAACRNGFSGSGEMAAHGGGPGKRGELRLKRGAVRVEDRAGERVELGGERGRVREGVGLAGRIGNAQGKPLAPRFQRNRRA